MPRVLHLIDSLGAGGIEMWLLRMVKAIPRKEYAMDFFCKGASAGPYAEKARQLGADVFHRPLRFDHVRFVRGLMRVLERGQYDIVHNHLDYAAAPGVWASCRMGVPVVSTFHNTVFPPHTWTRQLGVRQLREIYGRCSLAYTLYKSTYITGVSKGVLENLIPDHQTHQRCRVLYLGVEATGKSSQSQRIEFRRQLGLPPNTPIVLHVGRFANQKNHLGLLRIFKVVQAKLPQARLLLVGDGPERNAVEQAVEREGLGDVVSCLGRRDNVPQIMGCADVFLLPSFHEGFPVVSLEAGGAGLPVVGSDIPGLNEAVVDGQTGLLHPVHDEAAMADSVLRILDDVHLAERIRKAAATRIQKELSTEAVVQRLMQLYQDAKSTTQTQTTIRCAA